MANAAILKFLTPQIPQPAAAAAPTSPFADSFAMLSHRGRVRHANQDACAALAECGVFVVCDGMGGMAGGEIASQLATEAFLNSLSHPRRPPHDRRAPSEVEAEATLEAVPSESNGSNGFAPYPANHPHTRLHQAACAANHVVFQRAQRTRSLRGMGTTLVALLRDSEPDSSAIWLAHVGDSRGYLFRHGVLTQLTRDHSLVEEQIRAGLISRSQAATSPVRNIITRAIGSQPTVEPEIAAHATEPGDLYLLASDGLTRELTDAQIAHILAQASGSNLEPACQALIDAANKKGGRDNITVILVACS